MSSKSEVGYQRREVLEGLTSLNVFDIRFATSIHSSISTETKVMTHFSVSYTLLEHNVRLNHNFYFSLIKILGNFTEFATVIYCLCFKKENTRTFSVFIF